VVLVLTLVALSSAAPLLSPRSPESVDLRRRLEPPSVAEPLGTDELGRSTLARLLYGGRVTIASALLVTLAAAAVGVPIGLTSGLAGGRVDGALMRLVDAMLAVPGILLALALVAVMGPGLVQAASALALVEAPVFARLIRAGVIAVRSEPYVEAAIATGAGRLRVAARHVLPSVAGTVLIQASLTCAFAVAALSGVSFLGLGVQPPQADWGDMLARARDQLPRAWWLAVAPGTALAAAVLGFSFLGDSARDSLYRGSAVHALRPPTTEELVHHGK